ncbi:TetR/AcrR family transcriptional regulator C-terminal ligand-binding domain-containing protein [Geodermatophilus sp. DSM 44513]|uniref:TetR/AcrR family transcriptional regulator C-terminal ligand-binding domain-containing protein n=1 Tax=Geodermatophilus sp. DSM 44513 TaxID=1528104 RepID=UPI00127714D6|nr:TetR/AcrR family transcriptional regulator C-terminal ligand-binding domain-containing protein [Geodermatophilus sp. DSM 44513]WNV75191.1 TetR/AcrR family transcriptional regulator C-terminal ligand-binding domain-containing protein [Geodermatophilus sp. DSM 44513]
MSEVFSWQSPSSWLVLNAVLDTLAELGCAGLTTDEVKLRAGAAGPGLGDSPDLDALVIIALERVQLFPAPEPTGDLAQDLRTLLEPWRTAPSREERVVAAVLSAAIWSARLKVAVHESLDRPLMHAVSAVVARAGAHGHIPDHAVQTLCWLLRGLLLDRLRSRPRTAIDIDRLVDFLVAGLQTKAAVTVHARPPLVGEPLTETPV